MLEMLKKILGIGPSVDYAAMVKKGAIVLDVRTKEEFAGGHIKGSLNISVDQLQRNLHRLPGKQKVIITCCATGMRSVAAKRMLEAEGYAVVYNGGGWRALKERLAARRVDN